MIKDMLDQDIIEESTSPRGVPCLLIVKKNKSGYRFVVDYRKLNSWSMLDAHPLPTTDNALESLGTGSPAYFSTFDLQSRFYQVSINPASRPYTVWRCHLGLFQFKNFQWDCETALQHSKE